MGERERIKEIEGGRFLFLKNISGILSISFPPEKISHSDILIINLEF